ncbi:MAG: dockerin type I repeat-containing protein [Ruminococcus sp.]|nr:dockerin type I repeat-containing protein [Ruminococcus sp.]
MKKILSVFIASVIILSIVVMSGTSVFAHSSSLISDFIQEKLDAMDDNDTISLWIWLYSKIDIKAIEEQALIEIGLEGEEPDTLQEMDEFNKARTRLIAEFYEAENQAVIDKIGVGKENVILCSSLTSSLILTLTKTQVYEVAQMEEVASIDYYDTTVWDPPIGGGDSDDPDIPDYPPIPEDPEDEYIEIFVDRYGSPDFVLEYGKNFECESPWILFLPASNQTTDNLNPDPAYQYYVNGDYVISAVDKFDPFKTEYVVYSVADNEFIDLAEADFDKFEGLRDRALKINIVNLVGDLDDDDAVTVLDATKTQMILAKIDKLKNFYVADFNRDDKLSVFDATAIQKAIAKISE